MIHKPPYEQPWRWYADTFRHQQDTTFVKFDDDVVWMDTPRFGEVLEFLETRPNAIASANVANNAVCAKYEPDLNRGVRKLYGIGGDLIAYDKDWWNLHTDSSFAVLSHQWMLTNLGASVDREPVRTRPGERISINFVAMRYPTLRKVAGLMTDRLGDEGAVDALLPWIIPNFRVGHLSFGPQEVHPSSERWLNNLRNKYAQIPTNREVAR